MIIKLDQTKNTQAMRIHGVFQRAYLVEAQLIGVREFPPLKRAQSDILTSCSEFYGYIEADTLAAVIEIARNKSILEVHSLTVAPAFFRRGIADKLMQYVLNELGAIKALVETAAANEPALRLYKKHGFEITKYFTPDHGIEKVALDYTKK